MNRVFVTGDTHGGIDIVKLTSRHFPEGKELDKDDYVIVLGDFGYAWRHEASPSEIHAYMWFKEKPWTTLFIDGNHENFDRIDDLPDVEMFGGTVGKLTDSIYHLHRGQIYNIAGKKFFTFGGGYSIDKDFRIEGESWWAREMPNQDEYDLAWINLNKADFEVDYILTHSCSNGMFDVLAEKADMNYKIDGEDELRHFFDAIDNVVERKMWFFGHFHCDLLAESNGDQWQTMYYTVRELK